MFTHKSLINNFGVGNTLKKGGFQTPILSVIIPVYNEAENIIPMVTTVKEALAGYSNEIIIVDDGSTDATVKLARQIATDNVHIVSLSRNYGQTSAMSAGISQARGEYIATIDGDLQNDPSDIPLLLEKAQREDWDVVAGRRANRQDGWLLRKIPSKLANALIRKLTGVYLHDYGCTLKLFRNKIAKNLELYGELHRFIPVLAAMEGARITEVDVKHHPRRYGKSKYGLGRTTKVLSDLILMVYLQRGMRKPMHVFGTFGGGLAIAGLLMLCWNLIRYGAGNALSTSGLLGGIILALGGILFIAIGIMAEIQMRIYYESSQKKPYTIRKIYTADVRSEVY